VETPAGEFKAFEILSWTNDASVPLLTVNDAYISSQIFRKMRQNPALGDTTRDSWGFVPYRELDATIDKNLVTFSDNPPDHYWPVLKGASFDMWKSDLGSDTYYGWANPEQLVKHLFNKRKNSFTRTGSIFQSLTEAQVNDSGTLSVLKPRIAFRDVTRATDSRTVRAALIPPQTPLVNPGHVLMRMKGNEKNEAFLLGILCSIPLDWWARRIVETHLNIYIFREIPVPQVETNNILYLTVAALAARLAAIDERLNEWAVTVGVDCGPLEPDEKEDMIHELDAAVAHLYGLSEQQLRHIFETFHVGWDYEDRLKATIRHYRRLENSI